jgi:glycosyltransferase involved in cell wall biosynthesis
MNVSTEETKKRIAIFLPGLYDGGAERVMLNLASGLIDSGYAVDLILAQAEGPYLNDVPSSVRLVELNKKHLSTQRTLSSLPSLVRYIQREHPDAMLSGLNYANVVALWAKKLARVPLRLIITEHNTFSSERADLPRYFRWILNTLMKLSYPSADGIIAVSEGVADDLSYVLEIPRKQINVIYNPIITPEIQEKKNEPLEDPWFENTQPPVVLAIGRLTKQKGFDNLIRAFAQVRKQHIAHLLILGEGEDRPALLSLVKELGIEQDVRMPGFISNPYPYMANASLFVLSSRWEGLPTVLVEALYCGAPLIATDCPSGPREILKNGQYGQLVPVDNIVSLAQSISIALGSGKQMISPSSWQSYELNTVIGQYVKVLCGTQ